MRRAGTKNNDSRKCVAGLLVLLGALLLTGCEDSRFPVCQTDQDCNKKVEGASSATPAEHAKVCFDLRCVQCHYDGDCGEGEVCSTSTRECRRLDPKTPSAGAPAAGEPGSGVAPSGPRDPAGWEACVKKCANKDCLAKCDAQFE